MKMSLVSNEAVLTAVIECAVEKYGEIDIMEDYGMNVLETVEYIQNHCWLMTWYDQDLLAFVILEFVKDRIASIHFCKLLPGNILRGWKMFEKFIDDERIELRCTIDRKKESVMQFAERIGFEFYPNTPEYAVGRRQARISH